MKKPEKIFKAARSVNRPWNLLKTLLQTTVFWLFFLYVIPNGIWYLEREYVIHTFQGLPAVGWMMFVLFSILGLSSGYTMSWFGIGTPLPTDCPNRLVVAGPYKYLRNPMAVAGIGQGISVGLISGSYLVVFYALTGALLWHIFVRPVEEADLLNRFGKDYYQYKSRVKCWIPTLNTDK